jgi:hypothetical protein
MRRLVVFSILLAALSPSVARAGVVLGARVGVAIPGGEVAQGDKLRDYVDWALPLQVDLGIRSGDQLTFGAYLRLAPGRLVGSIEDNCDAAGASCSIRDLGVGLQLDLRLDRRAGPWLGGYAGLEVLRLEHALGGTKTALTATGWEAGVQGGIDLAWGVVTLGPYGSIGVGQFRRATAEVNGQKERQDITDRATHTWIQVGLRGGFAF